MVLQKRSYQELINLELSNLRRAEVGKEYLDYFDLSYYEYHMLRVYEYLARCALWFGHYYERPRCEKCPITDLCDYYKTVVKPQ